MNVTLRPEHEKLVRAKVLSGDFESAEAVVARALNDFADREQADGNGSGPSEARPIWEVIENIMRDTPPEEAARLPKDGASNIDHYVYGLPKKDA